VEIAKKIRKLCALGGSIWQPENQHGDFEKTIESPVTPLDLEHLFYYNGNMSILRRLIQSLFHKEDPIEGTRVFLQDEELIAVIKDVARQQNRAEEEVIADFTKAGINQFLTQTELESRWGSLSHREQQVVALICMGYRNYEIAQMLVIAPDTVKTHLQHIFDKFGLRGSKELRSALRNWDFLEWWEHNQQV
jgi:DNA-binding CsgD family transcriptional regulator